ncbi:MAG TPA: hypothetical protein VMF89_00060, partial [Polyangiales bacterium]|nr:hypothetical protein [Polyangiales bacterium]
PPTWDFPSGKVLRLPAMAGRSDAELGTLLSLCKRLFIDNWQHITFGTCIQGAVYELELSEQPQGFSMLDGYLTVVIPPGHSHLHLCIGPHQGLGKLKTPEAWQKKRPCARAALFRNVSGGTCTPGSWGLQLWNGAGEQMLNVFLPSPFLDDAHRRTAPNWSRLALWNELRARYLGETVPQPHSA